MAQYYLIPKRLARAYPALGRASLWLEARAFKLIFWVMKLLSPEAAIKVAGFAFWLTGPYTSKAKKADINLAIAFPNESEQWRRRTTREIFRSLGYAAAELLKLDQIWAQHEQRLEFVVHPEALPYLEQKLPVVFVTAHVGCWQVTNLTSLHFGLTISTVYAPESNPIMRDMMLQMRQAFGVKLIASDAGVRPLLKELNDGHSIGLAMDTRLDSGQLLPYFGREALTNTSAARLALRSGAAVIPVRGERLPGARFKITVCAPLVAEDESAHRDDKATSISTQINLCFEEWIRQEPEQWICLKRRWPKAHKL